MYRLMLCSLVAEDILKLLISMQQRISLEKDSILLVVIQPI